MAARRVSTGERRRTFDEEKSSTPEILRLRVGDFERFMGVVRRWGERSRKNGKSERRKAASVLKLKGDGEVFRDACRADSRFGRKNRFCWEWKRGGGKRLVAVKSLKLARPLAPRSERR